jgi:transcriptional regulator with XRE-family HTH domain
VPADIGLAIRQARLDHGLTQQELAELLEVSQSAISEMESGKSTKFLRLILEAFRATGITVSATWEADRAPGS